MICPRCNSTGMTKRLVSKPPTALDFVDPLGRRNTLRLEGEIADQICSSCQGAGEIDDVTYFRLTGCMPPRGQYGSAARPYKRNP